MRVATLTQRRDRHPAASSVLSSQDWALWSYHANILWAVVTIITTNIIVLSLLCGRPIYCTTLLLEVVLQTTVLLYCL